MKIKSYIADYMDGISGCAKDNVMVINAYALLYKATNDSRYLDIVRRYADNLIDVDGKINTDIEMENSFIDINIGKTLFFLYNNTNEEKYKKAIDSIREILADAPRTIDGNFMRKDRSTGYVFTEDMYHIEPFYMACETQLGKKEKYNDIINQFKQVKANLFDGNKGLYLTAMEEGQKKGDRLKDVFWLEATGFLLMGLIDTIEVMSEEIYEHYRLLSDMFRETLNGVLKYQDEESKLFYQVVDKYEIEGNYLETAGSAMIAYAILKGCKVGVLLKEKYQNTGVEILKALIGDKLVGNNERYRLTDISSGIATQQLAADNLLDTLTGNRTEDNSTGVAAFIMAYSQYAELVTHIGEEHFAN